ncbi:hypothetical protein BDP27DRAFT_1451233 [Rhodocollybia butyracea]|uniref:Uncharacterized protein n=1 Tax=Rhodocollybia butyracea TaxID=206335 RepID=A0A9P5PK17_9AGAR|nr:hypothetical protein BDP27DRAFT_1451233 [Rhodocollybia butyracea]
MSLKRSMTASSPVRASKRRQILFPSISDPVTPAKADIAHSFPSSSPCTPYPAYPSDSPTNPFGRTRTLSASLPPKSTFGRHMPLRFQFFRQGTNRDKEGVYRVVQVPLSYNFTHLKALIAFLFGGQAGKEEDEETGHLFEIRKNVAMYSKLYRPGTIRKSDTTVRLSSARDPYRYKDEWDYGDSPEEADEEEDEEEVDELSEGESGPEARWEAEEDYTVEHIWKPALKGRCPDDKTAIVYFHSSPSDSEHPVQVQITLYTGPVPNRTGAGNVPHVFDARGHVYLSPLTEHDLAEGCFDEDLEMDIDPETWNLPKDAFAQFLIDSMAIPGPNFHRSQDPRTTSTSSLVVDEDCSSITDLLPSSPYLPSSSPARAAVSKSSPIRFPSSFPKFTPAPPPAQRKRVAYIQKRIERSKRKPIPKLKDEDEASEKRPSVIKIPVVLENAVKAKMPSGWVFSKRK